LKGCALVIDDQVDTESSQLNSIFQIVKRLEQEGTLFIKLIDIPSDLDTLVSSMMNVSYVILDWKIESVEQTTLPAGSDIGSALRSTNAERNISFIKKVLRKHFIPIFIFTKENIDESVLPTLTQDEEIAKLINNKRLMVKSKDDLSGKKVIKFLNEWVNQNKTILTLKMFEEHLLESKNTFLVEMGNLASDWINVVYKTIKDDNFTDADYQALSTRMKKKASKLLNNEFTEFLTNSLFSRLGTIDFSSIEFDDCQSDEMTIKTVYESIKFHKYKDGINNDFPFEGDLYESEGIQDKKYYLNITAPCDLRDKSILLIGGTPTTRNDKNRRSFYVPMLLGNSWVKFDFKDYTKTKQLADFSTIKIGKEKFYRIGRLVHPFITAIRKECTQDISRQGTPRHP